MLAEWFRGLSPVIQALLATLFTWGVTAVVVWFPAVAGFLLGGVTLLGIDKLLPHLHLGYPRKAAEGVSTSWHRSVLLVLAITIHNIPEGLAVGVALG